MTYWSLNTIFLVIAVAVAVLARMARRHPRRLPVVITALVLFVVSVVFDNVMIGIGLVGYDRSLISGAFLGIAPLEDFAYVIGAALLLPALWTLLPARRPTEAPHNSGRKADEPPLERDGVRGLNTRTRGAEPGATR
ncbi:lycopene cyclase domain-containing protein [Subtercola boreus]|uniref:lycopene cyclase domain-containing protein n=1 Tax=Subtercola boreus TaxID=120213 RepID=UPI00209C3BC4|nr:lycopene cyclase domain-containing protein [Subtercola boreus]